MAEYELYHWGIKGMKWGVRRYQNKDGSLTELGKQHLANNRIRTEENLGEKSIPKGTKMYRTTPFEKDGRTSKSAYVTYLDVDRNLYKAGTTVNSYVDKKSGDNSVYEHEFELKTDIRIPSLKTVRQVENKVVADENKRQEVAKAWVESHLLLDGFTIKELDLISEVANKINKNNTLEGRRKIIEDLGSKYGPTQGDSYYQEAKGILAAKDYIDTNDSFTIERSLGRAHNVKAGVVQELQKMGYSAMYDNAGIGVDTDGKYTKNQEGIEPLIIFDAESTLRETNTRRVETNEQNEAKRLYEQWMKDRDEVLKKFK